MHSTDGGTKWTVNYSPPFAVADLLFNRDGQRGWAVGQDGNALMTRDGGRTWQAMPTASKAHLRRIVFDREGKTGLIVGENGLVLVSDNGGQNWRAATSPPVRQWALEISPDLSHAWTATETGVHLSRDRGRRWTPAAPAARGAGAIAFSADGKHGWAIKNGALIATKDSGSTWARQPTGTAKGLGYLFFLPDGLRGWVFGGDAGLLTTSDGGKSWQAASVPDAGYIQRLAFAADGIRGWAVAENHIYATNNGGRSWVKQFTVNSRFYDIAFDEHGTHGIAVGWGIYFTGDGGNSWTRAACPRPCNLLASVTLDSTGRRAWASGPRGAIFHTDNGGSSWSRQASGVSDDLVAIRFSRDGMHGLAIGATGDIVNTSDGGATWRPADTYARLPAPWYWVSVLLAAITAWLSWHLRPVGAGRRSVADVGASDAEIRRGADDRLEFSGLARGISRFLRNPATGAPLTLAINGPWGSGKSSLMRLVCADLRRFDHYPIWFNAWHHQKEEHLFAALLGAIRTQAVPPLLSLTGVGFRLRLLWLRSRKHFGIMILLLCAASTLTAINLPLIARLDFANLAPSIENLARLGQPFAILFATFGAAAVTLTKAVKPFHVNPALLITSLRDHMSVKTAAAQNDFRDQFAKQFGELTAALPHRLVIVIDDLDRCRPSAVLDVMEAVNYLTSSGKCIVIFGMARERVLASLGLAFKDIAAELVVMDSAGSAGGDAADPEVARRRSFAADYLQKLVNIEITVPSTRDRPLHELLAVPEPASRRAVLGGLELLWKLWPVAAAAAAVVAGLCLASWIQAGAAQAPLPAPVPIITQPSANPVPSGPAMPPTGKPTAVQEVPVAPRPKPADGPAAVQPGQQESPQSVLRWLAVALLPLLATGAWIVTHLLNKTVNETHDSGQFLVALKIWTPVVAARRTTPRAIKRFGNRMRYLAMLQQGEKNDDTQFDIVKRYIARYFGKGAGDSAPATTDALAEHQLIAMGAIHELYGVKWIDYLYPSPDISDGTHVDEAVGIIHQAIGRHQQVFETDWPPSDAEIAVFERLLSGVRLSGDPQPLRPARRPSGRSSAKTA